MPVNINSVIVIEGVANANKLQQTLSNVVRKGIAGTLDTELSKVLNSNKGVKKFTDDISKSFSGLSRAMTVSNTTVKNLTNLQTILRSISGSGAKGIKDISDILGNALPENSRKAQQAVRAAQRVINQLREAVATGNTARANRAASRIAGILDLDPKKATQEFRIFKATVESELNAFVSSYQKQIEKSSAALARETQKLADATDPAKIAERTQRATRGAQARELRSLLDSRFETLKQLRTTVEKAVIDGRAAPDLLQAVDNEFERTRTQRASLPTSKQELQDSGIDFQKEIENERKRLDATRQTANAIRSSIDETTRREAEASRQRAADAKRFAESRKALDATVAKADKKAKEDQIRDDQRRYKLREQIAKRAAADEAAHRKQQAIVAKEREAQMVRATRLAERYKVVVADAINTSAKLGRPITNEAQKLRSRIAELETFAKGGGVVPPGGGPPSNPPNNPPFDDDQLARFVREQNKVNKSLAEGKFTVEGFGKAAALAAKRYAAFVVGSAVFFRLGLALNEATRNAIEFESIITKIQQVINGTNREVARISDAIRDVATTTGVAAEEIGRGVLIFAQAGIKEIQQLEAVSDALAKTQLDATFDSIEQTSEGLLAIFGQFNKDLTDTTEILDLVRQFSADFAVESKDIFEAVERGGAVFSVAGGSMEEFIALFSVLRERTRESASTLGVFFKTGITQLLSPKSQTIIRRLGVESQTVVGQLRELSEVFFGLQSTLSDSDRINLANQLVGQRQISRLLSLLREIRDPAVQGRISDALELAPGSLDRATAVRLDDIGQSLQRISQAFGDVIKTFTQNEGLKALVSAFADITTSLRDFIRFASPAIPILSTIAALSASRIFGRGARAALGFAVGRPQSTIGAFLGGVNAGLRDVTGIGFSGSTRERIASNPLVQQRHHLPRQLNSITPAGAIPFSTVPPNLIHIAARENLRDNIPRNTGVTARLRRGIGGSSLALLGAAGVATVADQFQSDEPPQRLFGGREAVSATTGILAGAGIGGAVGGIPGAVTGGLLGGALSIYQSIRENSRIIRQSQLEQAKTLEEELDAIARGGRVWRGDSVAELIKRSRTGDEVGTEIAGLINKRAQAFADNFSNADRATIKELREEADRLRNDSNITSDVRVKEIDRINDEIGYIAQQSILRQLRGTFRNAFDNIGLDATSSQVAELISTVLKDEFKNPRLLQELTNRRFDTSDFRDVADNLRQSIRTINLFIGDLDTAFTEFARQVETISVDALSAISISPTSDNRRLLEQVGINLNDFDKQIRRDAELLTQFLDDASVRGRISNFFEGTQIESEDLGLQELFSNIFSDPNVAQKALDRIGPVIGNLAAQLGTTTLDAIKQIAEGTNVEDILREASPLTALEETIANAIRERIDVYNVQISKEREIKDAIRGNIAALSDLAATLRGLEFDALEARQTQEDFATDNRNVIGINRRTAQNLVGQATTSQFGSATAFASQIINARQALNAASQRAGADLRSGVTVRDIALSGRSQSQDDLQSAQQQFATLQTELGQRLSELDGRISAASRASNLLRDAFETLRGSIVAAGQTIVGYTQQDLASIFQNLTRFAGAGGVSDPGGALNALNLSQDNFNQLIQGLRLFGDLEIATGVTGNQVADRAFEDLATPVLATIRQIFGGGDQSENEAAIRANFEEIRKQQEAAAALEDQLRQEQISLVQTQRDVLAAEQQFFQDQLIALQTLADSFNKNTDIADIKTQVDRLFNQPLPTIGLEDEINRSPELTSLRELQDILQGRLSAEIAQFNQDTSIQDIINESRRVGRIVGPGGIPSITQLTPEQATEEQRRRRENDPRIQGLTKDLEQIGNLIQKELEKITSNFTTVKKGDNPLPQRAELPVISLPRTATPPVSPVNVQPSINPFTGLPQRGPMPGYMAPSFIQPMFPPGIPPPRVNVPPPPPSANPTQRINPFTGLPERNFTPGGIAPATNLPNFTPGIPPHLTSPGGIAPGQQFNPVDPNRVHPSQIMMMDPHKARKRGLVPAITGNTPDTVGSVSPATVAPPAMPSLDEITKRVTTITDLLAAGNSLLEKIASGGIVSRFEVAPVQVNVALTVPDVMALVGNQVKQQVLTEVNAKLSAIFSNDAEMYGRISVMGG